MIMVRAAAPWLGRCAPGSAALPPGQAGQNGHARPGVKAKAKST